MEVMLREAGEALWDDAEGRWGGCVGVMLKKPGENSWESWEPLQLCIASLYRPHFLFGVNLILTVLTFRHIPCM